MINMGPVGIQASNPHESFYPKEESVCRLATGAGSSLRALRIVVKASRVMIARQSRFKNYRGAKKEGQLVYYATMTLDQSRVTVDHFEKKYPFLKVTLFRTGGGPLLNKIICRVARRQT
jgi:hypothetical protein